MAPVRGSSMSGGSEAGSVGSASCHIEQCDVVVVGGGVSGLSAARRLLATDAKLRVRVLEAKDRVGGRTLTKELKCSEDGATARWDLGAQWVGGTQRHLLRLLEDLGLETFPQFIAGNKCQQTRQDGQISTYSGLIPSMPFTALLELNRFIMTVESLSRSVPVEDPYQWPEASRFDCMTIEQFKLQFVTSQECANAVDAVVRIVSGAEPSQVSVLFFLWYAACAGGMYKLLEVDNQGAQEMRIKGGAQQISEKLAEKIGANKVYKSSPVVSIDQTSEQEVIVITKDRAAFHCRRVILAIPPHENMNITFHPQLPVEKRMLFTHIPASHYGKFIATYPKAFWRDAGFSGEVVSNGGSTDAPVGPLGVVYDACDHQGHAALLGFYCGAQAVDWCRDKTPEDRKEATLQHLAQFFGAAAMEPLDFAEKLWHEEPYNGGCPTSVPSTGMGRYFARGIRAPFLRVHWAGTESATSWSGYMSGAVQAGHRAASEVLAHLRPHLPRDRGDGPTEAEKKVPLAWHDYRTVVRAAGPWRTAAQLLLRYGVLAAGVSLLTTLLLKRKFRF